MGKYNWDDEFLKLLSDLKDLNQDTAVDSLLLRFVSKFDSNKIALGVEKEDTYADDYEWITTYFANAELKKVLVEISQNNKVGDYYAKVDNQNYISFPHEDSLEKFDVTNYEHRLLLFYKFWNTVQRIAEQINLSPNYLSDLLRMHTGKSTQHIHRKLIEKAKEQLSTTTLSVSEIAFTLGFEHAQSFSTLFKKKTRLSPLEFGKTFN